MPKPTRPRPVAKPRLGIVVSRYNRTVTDSLLRGALGVAGVGAPIVVEAPGAFELPALAHALARTGRVDGIVALGCIIRGETIHDEVIAHAVAQGLVSVSLTTGVPVSLGVLTAGTPEQALARAGGSHGNKGEEAMAALLETLASMREVGSPARGRARRVVASPDKLAGRRA